MKGIRGFKDILPGEVEKWQYVEIQARRVFGLFGFLELRIPILERTELFARSIGEATDIVGKEMYTFPDRDGDSLTLRPEATTSIMRAYLEHGLNVKEGARGQILFHRAHVPVRAPAEGAVPPVPSDRCRNPGGSDYSGSDQAKSFKIN